MLNQKHKAPPIHQSKIDRLLEHKTKLSPQIFIFVALACEAKPLIQFFSLKKDLNVQPFSLYKSDQIILTVTGVGKVAIAASVAYVLALFCRHPYPALINIGIAGHKTQDTGYLYKAIKIIDGDTGKTYYPPLITKTTIDSNVLYTVSKPVSQYKADQLYDMEGSAFYETAIRFSSSELIQCFKIVSDNEHSSIDKINAKKVQHWISQQISLIDKEIKSLLHLSATLIPTEPDTYQKIIEEWHFTVSQRIRLKALLIRWKLLNNNTPFTYNKYETKNAKEILSKLETELNCLDFFL